MPLHDHDVGSPRVELPVLRPIGEDLWDAEASLRMPGGARLPCRMVIVRLSDGSLALHSPIAMDDDLALALERLGPVRHLIAPNAFHHLHLRGAHERYQAAELWAADGVEAKQPGMRIHHTLEDGAAPGSGELVSTLIAGVPRINETVFLHRPSQTLIVADLLFNVLKPENTMMKLVLTLFGTRGRLGHSRFWRLFIKDRQAFKSSVERLLTWDFSRLVMSHGEVVEREAKARVTGAFVKVLR